MARCASGATVGVAEKIAIWEFPFRNEIAGLQFKSPVFGGFKRTKLPASCIVLSTMIEFLLHATVALPPAHRGGSNYARHVVAPVSAETLYQRAMSTTIRNFNDACETVLPRPIAQESKHSVAQYRRLN